MEKELIERLKELEAQDIFAENWCQNINSTSQNENSL